MPAVEIRRTGTIGFPMLTANPLDRICAPKWRAGRQRLSVHGASPGRRDSTDYSRGEQRTPLFAQRARRGILCQTSVNRRGIPREGTMIRTLEQTTMRKVYLRVLPIAAVSYFSCYLDRINVGFAALTMNKDLGLYAATFGFAA